jgi:hypothetical protein
VYLYAAAVSVRGSGCGKILISNCIEFDMETIAFRLDERMQTRALESGAKPFPECGPEWVSFTLFRDDWPETDLKFWARKAYVAAREVER